MLREPRLIEPGLLLLPLVAVAALSACAPDKEPVTPPGGSNPAAVYDVLDFVDVFVGTGGDHGQLHPAATVPYGMIQMGAETTGKSHSGYDFFSTQLKGFTHNRMSGVGCRGAGGNLLVRADYDRFMQGPVALHKESEVARPGYYAVSYGPDRIRTELTASMHSGWQRYTFPREGDVWLSVDLSHAHHRFYGGAYTIADDGTVSGHVSAATVCDEGRYMSFFSLDTSLDPLEVVQDGENLLRFRYRVAAGDTLVVQAAFSSLDTANAEARRTANQTAGGFDQFVELAKNRWRDKLGRISVSGAAEKTKLFYSLLYRVFLSPHRLAEPGEAYRGSDGETYRAGDRPRYFGWSIWDTFRTKFPLLTIIDGRIMEDVTHSLAKLYAEGKPLWAMQTEPWLTVRTEHSSVLLLDAWQKGIGPFDAEALLPLLVEESSRMPRQSPDQMLEAAYVDWAVSAFAHLLKNDEIGNAHLARALEYRDLWREKFLHMGDDADVMHGDGLYEGTLWQYRWFVPFDTAWLIGQLNGNEGFSEELQYFFDQELFNIGNQPDIQAPFMFNFAGQAWRTQRLVFQLMNEEMVHWYGTHEKKEVPYRGRVFKAEPAAFIPEMDDDDGTMSGWYVFAAMGLFPAAPGVPVYTLHTPAFERIVVRLDNGNVFEVETSDPSKPYVRSATLNGQTLNRAWISHEEIMSGAKLSFVTADEPNRQWGADDVFTTSIGRMHE